MSAHARVELEGFEEVLQTRAFLLGLGGQFTISRLDSILLESNRPVDLQQGENN